MSLPTAFKSLIVRQTQRQAARKRLRGPASLHYTISEHIDDLNPAVWDALTANASWLLSRSYLKAMETALPQNLSPRYAIIRDANGTPLVAMMMQLATLRLQQTQSADASRGAVVLTEAIDKIAPGQRILVCGNMLTFGQHGLAFAEHADSEQAWHGVAEVLYRVRRAEKLSGSTHFMMIKDLHAPWHESAATLRHLSYRMLETEPNMVLEFDPAWKSWEDYLTSLHAKYRSNVKNGILKPLHEAECQLVSLTDLSHDAERIHALYKMVQINADFRPFELDAGYFPALQAVAGSRLRISGLRRHDELLGFIITLKDGDTAIAWHIGFDRQAAEQGLPLYLRLLHAAIADALALGCQRISFGRTALEPKAALGAKPQAFSVLLRHRQPILNKMIKHLLLGMEHDEAPERNPFKKNPATEPAN
ncbi:GNAT family N-acetyltransferase [Undibacterium squillarum]|uniref:BioF2-like acetyltransferase domain-containing protein n=1 Tax=Undibacterium squillarum TaxID=1131567 RepID=A0ABQ2XUU0_9BURK|nr:GNAT family N-acetyltransferase [Undibacterium squillarum]GGX35364.1 hypothetical protein GCM10010946_10980 [Undibacterium squillarum]